MKKNLLKTLVFASLLFFSKQALAWSGYEPETRNNIEISTGTTVAQGREISFFDFKTNRYHYGEVLLMDSLFSGTRLEIQDFETNSRRVFIMDR